MSYSRRDFIKTLELGTAALSIPATGLAISGNKVSTRQSAMNILTGNKNHSQILNNDPDQSGNFYAVGTDKPEVKYLEKPGFTVPRQLHNVAVEVYFGLLPIKMRFSMPCYYCMVTENNIHYSNGWTETYDPKASSSCEVLWDRNSRYARVWIESQNPARIIVRARAALCDPNGYIAHSNIPSKSPYGKGDWTDEWYYIYPDGYHIRHVRIYSGLAERSLALTDEVFNGIPPVREIPPNVVHEFQEEFIFGQKGHIPEDDIDSAPLTFIKPDGSSKNIHYKTYPKNFGIFRNANIMIVNLKSQYRPFTISLPYGLDNQPYPPEGPLPHIFQTWPMEPKQNGYSTSLGHVLNWWHYRRTENIIEQVYLSGMTNKEAHPEELTHLERSWIKYPRILMDGLPMSYTKITYDRTQRAYILPGDKRGPHQLKFRLGFEKREDDLPIPVSIVNPVFIVKNWGNEGMKLKIDGKSVEKDENFKVGHEETPTGIDLIVWVKYKSQKETGFEITPEY